MAETSKAVQDLEAQASDHLNRGEFAQAEALNREIIRLVDERSGPGWAMRAQYNLGSALVQQSKYEEATPLLRELVASLSDRTGREETPHFMQQETGALKLLASALEGTGRIDEADQMREEAERIEQQLSSEA